MQDMLVSLKLKILQEKLRGGLKIHSPAHPHAFASAKINPASKIEEQRERGPEEQQVASEANHNAQSNPAQYAPTTTGTEQTLQPNSLPNNPLQEHQQIAQAKGAAPSVAPGIQQNTIQPAVQPPQQGINMDEVLRNITLQNFQLQQMLLQNTLVAQVSASQQPKSFEDVMFVLIYEIIKKEIHQEVQRGKERRDQRLIENWSLNQLRQMQLVQDYEALHLAIQ
jgi:hypothetical protein